MSGDRLALLFASVLKLPIEAIDDGVSPSNTSAWDSLAAMALVAEIEDTFAVRLTTREIMKMRSVAAAREVLRAKGVSDV